MLGDHDLLPAPGSPQVVAQLVFQSLDTDFGHGTASLAEEVAARADRGTQRVQPVGVEPQKSRKPGLRATSDGRSGETARETVSGRVDRPATPIAPETSGTSPAPLPFPFPSLPWGQTARHGSEGHTGSVAGTVRAREKGRTTSSTLTLARHLFCSRSWVYRGESASGPLQRVEHPSTAAHPDLPLQQ